MTKATGTSLLHAGLYVHMLRIGSKHLSSDPRTSAQQAAVLVVPDHEMLTCPSGLPALLLRLDVGAEGLLQGPDSSELAPALHPHGSPSSLAECLLLPDAGLAYCRHLSTVRTHLSALVNHNIVSPDVPCNASSGLTVDIWQRYMQDSTVGPALLGRVGVMDLGYPGQCHLSGHSVVRKLGRREVTQPASGWTEPTAPNPRHVEAGE